MCDGDLMASVFVEEWELTCQEIEGWANLGSLECNSNDENMEFARSHCCEHYGEGNLIFLIKKTEV